MMPAGGMSTSTNDQTAVNNTFGGTSFGGFNIDNGIKTEWVVGGLVLLAAMYFFSKGRR